MKVIFDAHFKTDNDYHFDKTRMNHMFNIGHKRSSYKNSNISYYYDDTDPYTIDIRFITEGNSLDSRLVCRDLIEALLCSISTSKYYLVNDIYNTIVHFHDVLWTKEIINNTICQYMSGNYSGTKIELGVFINDGEKVDFYKPIKNTHDYNSDTPDEEYIVDVVKKARSHILNVSKFDFKPDEMRTINRILCECYRIGLLRKYEESDDGCYFELFCVKDNIPYSTKIINFKDMYRSLTTGLMDGIEKMIDDDTIQSDVNK